MSTPIVIGTFPKGRETVRVALDVYQGHNLIDIRACVEIKEATGVLSPTKKGLSVSIARLPELRRLLDEAEVKARELGWIGGES